MSADDVFFDTNVVAYLISADAAKADRSDALLRAGGVVSVQVLNEFVSVARRKHAMSWGDIRKVLQLVAAKCQVTPLTIETHQHGLDIAERYRLNVYDGMILATAELAGCEVVYSEDMKDGMAVGKVAVRNPYLSV